MIHDDVARHLEAAGGFDRAAMPLAIYLVWCAQHQLLADSAAAPTLVMRVRYREMAPAEFAVAGCGGRIAEEDLTPEGRAFTRHHYGLYLERFHAARPEDPYASEDQWALYDLLAADLTRWLMASRTAERTAGGGVKRWWQVWK